jgi:hypothetical protein
MRTKLTFDTFAGSEVSSRSAQQWVDAAVGTGVVTQGGVPASGDTETIGLISFACTASPVATSATGKTCANSMAIDCYGETPRLIAVRFINDTVAAPTAAEYELAACEFSRRTASDLDPVEGPEIVFDPTVGVASYIARAWRGGVATDDTQLLLAHDNLFHTIGMFVTGDGIVPFVDGVAFSQFAPATLQPNVGNSPKIGTGRTPVGSVTNPAWRIDWALYG